MDMTAIIIFASVFTAVTALIIVGCKLFARYCFRLGARSTLSATNMELGNLTQNRSQNTVNVIITGPASQRLQPLMRHRSLSLPEVDRRQPFYNARTRAAAKELPPNYNLAVSHPSIYKRRSPQVVTRQISEQPPNYDDLDHRLPDFSASSPNIISLHDGTLRQSELNRPVN